MIRAACTIVSINYLPYARTLCASFLQFHPNYKFYVLLVDRLPDNYDLSHEKFELVLVSDLGIPNFESVAFKYDIIELNTNVKPTFLKKLLAQGVGQLIYFDPDILLYSPVDIIFDALATNGIVLTPHATSPNEMAPASEVDLLMSGVFNLGFIAVSNTAEVGRFLSWWELRCLALGYNERWSGLFVDQKWINLVPCYFESVKVLKHPGCNVAYWNLHERTIEKTNGTWVVNEEAPLIFFISAELMWMAETGSRNLQINSILRLDPTCWNCSGITASVLSATESEIVAVMSMPSVDSTTVS